MNKSKNGSLKYLDTSAKLFEELKIQKPVWWTLLKNDDEIYIDIRKNNYINAYFFGGSIVKLEFKKNRFVGEIHQKYLDNHCLSGEIIKNNNKKYVRINLNALDETMLDSIKKRINEDYLGPRTGERPSEKYIQGKIIKNNPNIIDSEFQYNQNSNNEELRVDLVELSDGVLSFIELKRIDDRRLRIDEKRNSGTPEIIVQINKYREFIKKNEEDIKDYYNRLLKIKQSLGLNVVENKILFVNNNPKLIIANSYSKKTRKRDERIRDIEKLLQKHGIDYTIIPWN